MKVTIVFMMLFPIFLKGQFYFEIGDTLTITAKSGLNLRDSSTINSSSLTKIKFAEKVIALSQLLVRDEINNRLGYWINVQFNDIKGFVFSGYLTKAKIPKFDRIKYCNYKSPFWWEELIRLNVDTLKCNGSRGYKGFDPDKGGYHSEWEFFTNETEIYYLYGYEHYNLVVETNELTTNDLLNLLEYYISEMKSCDPTILNSNKRSQLEIKIEKEKYGYSKRIKKIECKSLHFTAQRTINKTMFSINLEGL